MAKEKKGSHYEMVLEDRHLLGVFFAVVLLCALFFTLGFILGRNQATSRPPASAQAPKPPTAAQPASAPAADDLSFYQRVEGKQPTESLPAPASPPASAESKPASKTQAGSPPAESKPAAKGGSAPAPKPQVPAPSPSPVGASPLYLQVAAVTQEPDAQRLVAELRKLGFPATIVSPREDRFYRVQVGPFENAELAAAAQRRLEAQGFRDIIKR